MVVTYPRTVTRGLLKGQIVVSSHDHQTKLIKAREAVGTPVSGLQGTTATRLLDAYDELLDLGIDRRRAKNLVQRIFGV